MIHTSNLTDDYYAYDESHMALIGRRFHHIYQIGQPVRVKLIRVDTEQSALDFILVDPDAAPITDIKVADDRRGSFGGKGGNHKSQVNKAVVVKVTRTNRLVSLKITVRLSHVKMVQHKRVNINKFD
ncbi:Ribonuclease R [Weissella viridescens]|uniref:Ribonuclease R n=1 Tax=Weissella viridescens TaxID=1629 RepID=A0A380NVY9_WEIVI|nr:Ribonuclease R [Weissella viridescens]